jgi:hypothetical protein
MKHRFTSKQKAVITVDLSEEEESKIKRGMIPPVVIPDYLKRRLQNNLITFYDLGLVNHATEGSPVFEDHPILKTPSFAPVGVYSPFAAPAFAYSERGEVEGFTTADYQAYTDMMFNYPVEEWHFRYKKLEYEAYIDKGNYTDTLQYGGTDYPSKIIIYDKNEEQAALMRPTVFGGGALMFDQTFVDYGIGVPSTAAEIFNTYGLVWSQTTNKFKNLPYLKTKANDRNANGITSFFPFDTSDKTEFKVTLENDADAGDVGVLVPKGKTEVYLMPHISCWAAAGNSSDQNTKYVLGPVYQINPRKEFPSYVERGWTQNQTYTGFDPIRDGEASNNDYHGLKQSFLEYQMGREGMQAGTYSRSAYGSAYSDMVSMDPGDFPVNDYGYYSSTFTREDPTYFTNAAANPDRADLYFQEDNSAGNFFTLDEPFLCAVIKTKGRFYYVWNLPPPDFDWDFAADRSNAQGLKYRISKYNYSDFIASAFPLQDDTEPFLLTF